MRRVAAVIATVAALAGASLAGLASHPAGAQGAPGFVAYDCTSEGSAGLQAAEDALPPGGTLYVSGECTGDLTLQSGTTLEGNNAASTIDGSVIFDNAGGDGTVTIRSIHVNCGTENACLDIRNGWHLTITGVYTKGGTYGIELSAPDCAKGSGCNVNDYLSGNMLTGFSEYGFFVNDPANTITDGHFDNSWVGGGVTSIFLKNAAGWFVDDDHTYGNSSDGIHASRAYGSQFEGNLLEAGDMTIAVQQGAKARVVIADNRLDKGGIIQTAPDGPGCSVVVYGNDAANPLSTSGNGNCTVTQGLNLP